MKCLFSSFLGDMNSILSFFVCKWVSVFYMFFWFMLFCKVLSGSDGGKEFIWFVMSASKGEMMMVSLGNSNVGSWYVRFFFVFVGKSVNVFFLCNMCWMILSCLGRNCSWSNFRLRIFVRFVLLGLFFVCKIVVCIFGFIFNFVCCLVLVLVFFVVVVVMYFCVMSFAIFRVRKVFFVGVNFLFFVVFVYLGGGLSGYFFEVYMEGVLGGGVLGFLFFVL